MNAVYSKRHACAEGQKVPDRVTLSGGFDTARSYAVQLTARVDQRDLNPLLVAVRRDAARVFNVRAHWQRAQFQAIVDRLSNVSKPNGLFGRLANSLASDALSPIGSRVGLLMAPLAMSLDVGSLVQELTALRRTPEWYGAIVAEMYQNDDLFLRTTCTLAQCASDIFRV